MNIEPGKGGQRMKLRTWVGVGAMGFVAFLPLSYTAAASASTPSAPAADNNCPNPAGNLPPGQCNTSGGGAGANCPNPAGKYPPGQCKKVSLSSSAVAQGSGM